MVTYLMFLYKIWLCIYLLPEVRLFVRKMHDSDICIHHYSFIIFFPLIITNIHPYSFLFSYWSFLKSIEKLKLKNKDLFKIGAPQTNHRHTFYSISHIKRIVASIKTFLIIKFKIQLTRRFKIWNVC